jgi:DNA-directed RNA polymerase specialized sigma24 family protein
VQPARLIDIGSSTIEEPFTQPALVPVVSVSDFASWYTSARPRLGRALTISIGDADLAREAVDEAMTRAFASWSRVSRLDSPEGWVYRVAFNWAVSVFRRRNRPVRALHNPPADMPVPVDRGVAEALQALDVNHRAVIVCRYVLGWSELETAAALNIRPGTAKSRLARASAQLRTQLQHLRPEDSR